MSETLAWDGSAKSMVDVLAQEKQRLESSRSVYAVIDFHGQLLWKDTVLKQLPREPTREDLQMSSPDAPLRPQAMLEAVDPRRGTSSRIPTLRTSGVAGIRGYRPEPTVARSLPEEYPVNLVGRRVLAALARGMQQTVSEEELRGNLILCGMAPDGRTEMGLSESQQQLVGVAYYAASVASGAMSSYRVVGVRGEQDVFLPELYDPISPESARLGAWKLSVAADTVEGRPPEQNAVPAQMSSTAGKEPRWTSASLRSTRK